LGTLRDVSILDVRVFTFVKHVLNEILFSGAQGRNKIRMQDVELS